MRKTLALWNATRAGQGAGQRPELRHALTALRVNLTREMEVRRPLQRASTAWRVCTTQREAGLRVLGVQQVDGVTRLGQLPWTRASPAPGIRFTLAQARALCPTAQIVNTGSSLLKVKITVSPVN